MLGEWGGGGVKVTVGVLPSRYRALITRKEVSCASVAAGFCFCFCFLLVVFFFFLLHGFYFENAITDIITIIAIIIITVASTIISEQNRMQSCYAWGTVQHLNNHPHGR